MEYEIRLNNKDKYINLRELIVFLQTIRATYIMALFFLNKKNGYPHVSETYFNNELIADFRRYISNEKYDSDSVIYHSNLAIEENIDLNFSQITQNSPLKFVGKCSGISVVALSLSVAISGGEVDLRHMKFTVKPLSEFIVAVSNVFINKPKNDHGPQY
jgi:hypothetical protein